MCFFHSITKPLQVPLLFEYLFFLQKQDLPQATPGPCTFQALPFKSPGAMLWPSRSQSILRTLCSGWDLSSDEHELMWSTSHGHKDPPHGPCLICRPQLRVNSDLQFPSFPCAVSVDWPSVICQLVLEDMGKMECNCLECQHHSF